MRVLAFADEPPPADAAELVAANQPDLVVTLGDLEPGWMASLASTDAPKLGVHGNHDAEDALTELGVRDVHMTRVEVGGWSFAGFGGSVRRHTSGVHQYSQEEAALLVRGLPAAEVLLTHSPPFGVNDGPTIRHTSVSKRSASGSTATNRGTCCMGTPRPTPARVSGGLVRRGRMGARCGDGRVAALNAPRSRRASLLSPQRFGQLIR
jgi:uncharacterized protein